MITEDYVSFETAKLLKEKGFNEKCNSFYRKTWVNNKLIDKEELDLTGTLFLTNSELQEKSYELVVYCTAPTLQMAMKWLREVHNYDISICLDSYVEPYDNQYYIVIRRRKDKYENISPCEQVYFDAYEEACEAAIKYCLENLI